MTSTIMSRVLGTRLKGVGYDLFEWEEVPSAKAFADVVPMAILLEFDETSALLKWDLDPPSEQLTILWDEIPLPGPLIRRVDVSKRWGPFLDETLLTATWAQHETGDGWQPWAVTLAFSNGSELVVALGEMIGGSPSYLPDSLIITASREISRSYQPKAALTPAWTAPV